MDHGEKFAKNLGSYILLHEIWKLKTKRSIKINLILLQMKFGGKTSFMYIHTCGYIYIHENYTHIYANYICIKIST